MKKCQQKFLSIAWDTEIWVAEEQTHMIHKNGDKFIGGTYEKISVAVWQGELLRIGIWG